MKTLSLSTNFNTSLEKNTITPDVFETSVANELVRRFENVKPDLKGEWGKMNVGQHA